MPYMAYVDQYGQPGEMGQDSKQIILTPALCRAARGLLDWTQSELAERSEISRSTIRDYEGSRHDVHRATAAQIRRAFEDGGVVFMEVEGCGLGVCQKGNSTSRPA
ncbi:MAG TPA: helix-turn-helix transcriptional regulator [Shinella sp.]|nr:helix-turn-helix transcriptional regulator [Shinella sp.]